MRVGYLNSLDSRITLTDPVPNMASAVYSHDFLVQLQPLFSTRFTWNVQSADPNNVGGFALFFANLAPTNSNVNDAGGSGLGIRLVPDLSIIAYDHAQNLFIVCDWSTPNPSELRDSCPTFNNPQPRLAANQSHEFQIFCNGSDAKVSVNGIFLFSANLRLNRASPVVVGFSGASGQSFSTQSITKWEFYTRSSVPSEPVLMKYRIANFDKLSDIYYKFGSANGTATGVILSSANSPGVGGVVHKTPFTVHRGFTTIFSLDFRAPNCASNNADDGITIFFASDPAVFEPKNRTYYNTGIDGLRNLVALTFNPANGQPKLCIQGSCSTLPLQAVPCATLLRSPMTLKMMYNGFALTFSWQLETSSYFAFKAFFLHAGSYYVGIIGSDRSEKIQLTLRDWQLFSMDDVTKVNYVMTNPTQELVTKGPVAVVAKKLLFDKPTISGVGLVQRKMPLPLSRDFYTSFYWSPVNCSTLTKGFSFYFTKTPLSSIALASNLTSGMIGTANMQTLTSFTYSFDMSNGTTVYYKGLTLSVSRTMAYSCNAPIQFTIEFADNSVDIYKDTQTLLRTQRLPSLYNPDVYYIGLSGYNSLISDWTFAALAPPSRKYFALGPFEWRNAPLILRSAALVVGNQLRLTTGGSQAGAAVYNAQVSASLGFKSTIVWTPSNCDQQDNGGDGFTLFFAKNGVSNSQVSPSSGGSLGVRNVPKTFMLAYSAIYNEFYVCNWTNPFQDNFRYVCAFTIPAPGPKMTCPNTFVFDYSYVPGSLSLRLNGTQQFSVEVLLDAVPYYVGLSGGTGGSYFQQDVSHWSYEGTTV